MSKPLINMAIEILRATDDGERLDPTDLYLVQETVNGNITELGEVAFYALHNRVMAGEYKKPWLCGVENLTIDHEGFVYWKGIEVEHYSFQDAERERKAAEELASRCRHLEEIGVPVSCNNAVWGYEKYEGVTA